MDASLRPILYGASEEHPKPKNFSLNRGQMFPEKLNLMDYRFDNKENWWPWLKSDDVHIPVDATLSDIIINTKESGYINNWLDICFSIASPILFVGPTGKNCRIYHLISQSFNLIFNRIDFQVPVKQPQL